MHFIKFTAISVLAFALAAVAAPVDNGSNAVAAASPQQAGVSLAPAVLTANKLALGSLTSIAKDVQLPQLTSEQQQTLQPVFAAINNIKAIATKNPKTAVDIGKDLETIRNELKKIEGTANDKQIVASILAQAIEALVPAKGAENSAANTKRQNHGGTEGQGEQQQPILGRIIRSIVDTVLGEGNVNLAGVIDHLFSPEGLLYKLATLIDGILADLPIVGPILGGPNSILTPILGSAVEIIDNVVAEIASVIDPLI
ncbi:hypothetical protein H4219_002810 [Mycoemilia scoparia]|uniref:Uncharacterized protein n=1 Tax=Mycoemilia scoparia TaxID=417184 RepID=A0A9W7ZWH2_9FUNG|nr:hypothetical protein H4219_002810 [Mycoemilia scoparia]